MKIYAGIVSYNPDLERLDENISAIENQVEKVVLFDNGSVAQQKIVEIYNNHPKIHILTVPKNQGIAAALNGIMRFAISNGVSWVLTLDQDTICESQLIENFLKFVVNDNVAIICPSVRDRNRQEQMILTPQNLPEFEYIDCCVTSGSLTRVSVVEEIGFFNEAMFINEVDTEFCIRLILIGYKIVRVNTVSILHELGRLTHYFVFPRLGNIFNVDYFKRVKYTSNHSTQRKYYMVRNNIYLFRKYRRYNFRGKKLLFVKTIIAWFIWERGEFIGKSKALFKGIYDGVVMKLD